MTTVVIPGNNKTAILKSCDCRGTLIALGVGIDQELITKRRSLWTIDLTVDTPVPSTTILYGFLILRLPDNNS